MKLEEIVNLLKKSGINSKKQVIDMLENASENDLIDLSKDCNRIVAEKRAEKGRKKWKKN